MPRVYATVEETGELSYGNGTGMAPDGSQAGAPPPMCSWQSMGPMGPGTCPVAYGEPMVSPAMHAYPGAVGAYPMPVTAPSQVAPIYQAQPGMAMHPQMAQPWQMPPHAQGYQPAPSMLSPPMHYPPPMAMQPPLQLIFNAA